MAQLTIGRRTYQVAANPTTDRVPFILTGPRGATYGAVRHYDRPDRLFLVSGARSMTVHPLGLRWFEISDGALVEIGGQS